jgi:DNA-binding transcriptional ArsR family regulator
VGEEAIVRSLAALAQPHRLRVFRALVAAGPPGMTAGALAEAVGLPPNTLSFHLKELSHAELVAQQRDGRFLIYSARFEAMNGLIEYLSANCCQGKACTPRPRGKRC